MAHTRQSILIVDDDVLSIEFLVDILHQDYTLFIAKDGEAAIHLAALHRPHLILLDIIMPGIDGYQTIDYLHSLEELQQTPIVFISSLTSTLHQELGRELNADAYLEKPLTASQVLTCVQTQLSKG